MKCLANPNPAFSSQLGAYARSSICSTYAGSPSASGASMRAARRSAVRYSARRARCHVWPRSSACFMRPAALCSGRFGMRNRRYGALRAAVRRRGRDRGGGRPSRRRAARRRAGVDWARACSRATLAAADYELYALAQATPATGKPATGGQGCRAAIPRSRSGPCRPSATAASSPPRPGSDVDQRHVPARRPAAPMRGLQVESRGARQRPRHFELRRLARLHAKASAQKVPAWRAVASSCPRVRTSR